MRTRKLTPWNLLVKKVYKEGKSKNPKYEFKHALKDASKRKGEIKMSSTGKKRHMNMAMVGGRTKRRRKH